MALITIDQLNARLGRTLAGDEQTQALAMIDDASALVLQIAAGAGTEPTWGPTAATPGAVVAVLAQMIRRAMENPRGLSGEQLGDYQWQAGAGQTQATIYATARETRIIRRAAGRLGVGEAQLEGYLLTSPDYDMAGDGGDYDQQLIDVLQ